MQAQDILNFWFTPDHQPLWFAKSDAFDAKIRELFNQSIIKPHKQNFGLGVKLLKDAWPKLLF